MINLLIFLGAHHMPHLGGIYMICDILQGMLVKKGLN